MYFPHADADYLYPQQHDGGAALLPEHPGSDPLPLVVFLHGVNPGREMHLWFRGRRDLRPVARRLFENKDVRPFILAGPSQTRSARTPNGLWANFDLTAFVEDVERAIDGRAVVDRKAVIFFGHSGAGCSLHGGLASDFWSHNHALPLALIAVDPCLDADSARALSQRPASVPLWLMWQSAVWPRRPATFRRVLSEHGAPGRVDRIEELQARGPNPHDSILPVAFERAARELLARRESHGNAS